MLNRPTHLSNHLFDRDEIPPLLILRHNPSTLFFRVYIPDEMILQTKYFLDLLDALKEVADGKLIELKNRLDLAKRNKELLKVLLLQKDDTVTPAGLTVKNTTLLGCAICAGDPEIVAMIKPYFLELPGGEKELEKQLEYYGSCIEEIQTQKPDDLTWLINIILASSLEDVRAELATGNDYNPNYQSPLRDAFNKFRADKLDPAKRIIDTPRMHCNYQNLIHAYEILDHNWDRLKVNGSCDKQYLISRQIIGLIQLLELPAYERYMFARGQIDEAIAGEEIERSFTYRYNRDASYPRFDHDLITGRLDVVGFKFHVSKLGAITACWGGGGVVWPELQNLCQTKTSILQDLCSTLERENIRACNNSLT